MAQQREDIPAFEERFRLVIGMVVVFFFVAIFLGKMLGLKAGVGILLITAPIWLAYLLAPRLFFRQPKAAGKAKEGERH